MAYSDFSYESLRHRFDLSVEFTTDLIASVKPVVAPEGLSMRLRDGLPLAIAQNTEKSRSELIIAPILLHLWQALDHRVSVFSGVDFNVERKTGLVGYCDYILSLSANALSLEAPAVALVEAKKEDVNVGVPQCIAEMVAAQRFNEQRRQPVETIYGCVTSGTVWRFLRLQNKVATVDLSEVYIGSIDRIFGILLYMVGANPAGTADAAATAP